MKRDRADAVAAALLDTWRDLLVAHPAGWVSERDGIQAAATGIPAAGLNGVWCSSLEPDPAELERLLGELDERGLPHMLQVRPGAVPTAAKVAERRGLVADEEVPLMRLDDATRIESLEAPDGLTIRQLDPDEAEQHALAAAAGFGLEPEHFLRLIVPEALRVQGTHAYVGEVDGEIVTTGLGATLGDSVGVFNVATPEAHRRRGYGAAITVRVVTDGLAAGADWAWLQSSQEGFGVYEALGFETVERWSCWVRP
jgi:ribosomal protein S18 acetylase RimI-like enzyme